MDPATIPTPSDCSTVSTSSLSMQEPPPNTPFHLLEISLISAQDLTPINKSMRTYAVAWTNTNPSRRLNTRTDQNGHTHPTWNEKLTFRVGSEFLLSDESAINIEIYTTSWFREVLVGTVTVLISDLLTPLPPPPPSSSSSTGDDPLKPQPQPQPNRSIRFVTLQVRRPSGAPQGILNMGVALLDSSMRSMQLVNNLLSPNPSGYDVGHELEKKVNALNLEESQKKIHLWRSLSVGSDTNLDGPGYNSGSVINGGSMVNGSELCSDIGPSASIVAADLARKCQPPPQQTVMIRRASGYEDTGSSIIGEMTMEEAKAKGYRIRSRRWREQAYDDNRSDVSSDCSTHSRRKSDSGLFTCFGTAYGIEFRIVCGTPTNNPGGHKRLSYANSVSTSRKNSKAAASETEAAD